MAIAKSGRTHDDNTIRSTGAQRRSVTFCAFPNCSNGRSWTAAGSRSGGYPTSSPGSAVTTTPVVTGLVATVGGREVYVPIEQVGGSGGEALRLTSDRLDLRHFERRPGEVLLKRDVLGHRLIDVETARLVRAADVELERRNGERVVVGVDTRRRPPRLLRALPLSRVQTVRRRDPGRFRDWKAFEALIGHTGSALLRGPFGRIRRLKPAQIADLLEDTSKEEQTEILGQVHEDPELEADVFEELDEDRASRLLGARTNEEIAEVLQPDAARRRGRCNRRAAAEPAAAGHRSAAARGPHQGPDPDGLQPGQRRRPDGGRFPGLAIPTRRWRMPLPPWAPPARCSRRR